MTTQEILELACSFPEREISASNPPVSEENVPIGKSLWRKRQ